MSENSKSRCWYIWLMQRGKKGSSKGGSPRPTVAYAYAYYNNLVATGSLSEGGFWQMTYEKMKTESENTGKKCDRSLWSKLGKAKKDPWEKKYKAWKKKQAT